MTTANRVRRLRRKLASAELGLHKRGDTYQIYDRNTTGLVDDDLTLQDAEIRGAWFILLNRLA